MTQTLHFADRTGRTGALLCPARALLSMLLTLLVSGCTDPNAPEFLNTHDGVSAIYVPSAPSSTQLSAITERSRLLSWTRTSTAETGFWIMRRSGPAGTFETIGNVPAGTVSYLDTTIIRTDLPYLYRIIAHAANGRVGPSDSVGFTLAFPVPQDFYVNSASHDGVGMVWNGSGSFAEGYGLERRTRTTDFVQVATFPAHATDTFVRNLDTTQDYAFRIRGYTSLNTGAPCPSAEVVFTPAMDPPVVAASVAGDGGITHVVSDDGSLMLAINVGRWYQVFDAVHGTFVWGRDQRDMGASGFSGDNSIFAFSTTDGSLHLVRTSDGMEVRTIAALADLAYPSLIAVNKDGSLLAYGQGSQLVVYAAREGQLLLKTTDHAAGVNSLDFSPDGKFLACATGSNVELWSMPDCRLAATLPCVGEQEFVCCGPHGKLASRGHDARIRFWDTGSGTLISTVAPDWFNGNGGGFDAEGTLFATEYQQYYVSPFTIGICRVSDGAVITSYAIPQDEPIPAWIGFSTRYAGRNAVVTAGFGQQVRVRNTTSLWLSRPW